MNKIVLSMLILCVYMVQSADKLVEHEEVGVKSYRISNAEQKYHQLYIPTTTPVKPVFLISFYQFTDCFTLLFESCLPNKQVWRNVKNIRSDEEEHSDRLLNYYLYDADVQSQNSALPDGVGTRYRNFVLTHDEKVERIIVDGPNKEGFIIQGLCKNHVNVQEVKLLFLQHRSENRGISSVIGVGQWRSDVLTYDEEFNNYTLHTLALDPDTNRVALSLSDKTQELEKHTLEIFDVTPAESRLDGSGKYLLDNEKALFELKRKSVLAHSAKKIVFFSSICLGGLLGKGTLTFFTLQTDETISSEQPRSDICFKDFAVHRNSIDRKKGVLSFAALHEQGDVYCGTYSLSKKNIGLSFLRTIPNVAYIENFFHDGNELRVVYRSENTAEQGIKDNFRTITKIDVYSIAH